MNSVKNETMRKEEVKATATLVYQKITTAYDILKHDEHRNDSSYMVAHPEEYYLDYFYFYRTLVPKVDVEIVIAVTVSVASVIQYLNAWEETATLISHSMKVAYNGTFELSIRVTRIKVFVRVFDFVS
ncbi:Hypothetical predicted protein [Octopus vulgaris]|uniref:Uncharacterized protein n=1 Tax=Octopus vulgaris TaxID=6645 RepID=A0AA36AW85_OCTVU|nr:Hypothetical predicted protein [Octopus vulgaris]